MSLTSVSCSSGLFLQFGGWNSVTPLDCRFRLAPNPWP